MEQERGQERVNEETAKRDGKTSNLDIWIRMIRVIRRNGGSAGRSHRGGGILAGTLPSQIRQEQQEPNPSRAAEMVYGSSQVGEI